MEWKNFWDDLLTKKKLKNKVKELDAFDSIAESTFTTEDICKKNYYDYDSWYNHLVLVRESFLKTVEKIDGIHLSSSRIKSPDSLIAKVINKRYENIKSRTNAYARINEDSYKEIITDLIGMRLIINYRGKWIDMHNALLDMFPMRDMVLYERSGLIPHEESLVFQAERPKAYYAAGDNYQQYTLQGLLARQHEKGYRSIHYTVSYQSTYIEIQVRTIYDEAWSDCDHNYVYKQEANPCNHALGQLSKILCGLTNVSSDIGENMYMIFNGDWLKEGHDNKCLVSQECMQSFDSALGRLEESLNMLRVFRNNMVVEKMPNNEG